MSAVNPLFEPGVDAEPSIPRDVETEQAEKPAVSVETEAKTPETKPEPKAEEKPQPDDREKYENVRKALKEEREAKAALRAEVEALRRRTEEVEAVKRELEQYRMAKQQEAANADFENDPAQYLKRQLEETQRKIGEVTETTKAQQEEAYRHQQFIQAVQSQTAAFASQTPDYPDAFQYMHDRRMAEYDILGVPPEYREAQFNHESLEFAAQAMNTGRNPAELAYHMAKAWGWAPKAAAAAKTDEKADPNKVVERLAEGQKAAATLSSGGRAEESLLKRVDQMSDAEFDKFWKEELMPKHR